MANILVLLLLAAGAGLAVYLYFVVEEESKKTQKASTIVPLPPQPATPLPSPPLKVTLKKGWNDIAKYLKDETAKETKATNDNWQKYHDIQEREGNLLVYND